MDNYKQYLNHSHYSLGRMRSFNTKRSYANRFVASSKNGVVSLEVAHQSKKTEVIWNLHVEEKDFPYLIQSAWDARTIEQMQKSLEGFYKEGMQEALRATHDLRRSA